MVNVLFVAIYFLNLCVLQYVNSACHPEGGRKNSVYPKKSIKIDGCCAANPKILKILIIFAPSI
jgi:hypothetical protein